MRYKITQTLLSAWNYLYECYEEGWDEAYASFLTTLRREPSEQTEAMLNGIAFENEVYKIVLGLPRQEHKDWENGIQEVAKILIGAQLQVPLSTDVTIDGTDFTIYGILDGLKAGHIYDVKFSSKSFNSAYLPGKYLGSPQHPAYFALVPEAKDFTYLVSDGDDIYTERYTPKDTIPIQDWIAEFQAFLKENNLFEEYKEKWIWQA